MNRPIEFRAWDKITKQMCEVWDIGFRPWRDNDINYVRIFTDGTIDRLEHEVELIQWTGLKDNNGVKIFEGDIVDTLSGYIKIVIWDEQAGGFYLKQHEMKNGYDPIYYQTSGINNAKVIGNIYQNPELLEK